MGAKRSDLKRPLRLAKFTIREDLETIEPDAEPGKGRVLDAENKR